MGRYKSIPAEESRIGGGRGRFAQVGKAQFLANGHKRFFGRADITVVRIKGALVNGKTREEFAAVEIVLRKTREPESRRDFVALLHEMAAFVNLAKKQADGNVFGDFAFDPREFFGLFIHPDESANFGVNGSEARGGFEGRVGFHTVLRKHAFRARLASDQGKKKRVARCVDEVVALFLFLRELFHGVALRATFVDKQGERSFQFYEFGAIRSRIRGSGVGADRNTVHTGAGWNDSKVFYRRWGGIVSILTDFQALDALVNVQGFFVFLLHGDDAVEQARFRRADRRRGLRNDGLRRGARREREGKHGKLRDCA